MVALSFRSAATKATWDGFRLIAAGRHWAMSRRQERKSNADQRSFSRAGDRPIAASGADENRPIGSMLGVGIRV